MTTSPQRARFSAKDRASILARVPGKPSGVLAQVGGMEFDLVAVSNAELLEILEIAYAVADIFDSITKGEASNSDLLRGLGQDGPKALDFLKAVLKRSAFMGVDITTADAQADISVFEEWFALVPAADMLREVFPKLLQANGLGQFSNPTTATPVEVPATSPSEPQTTPSDSTPSTLSSTS